MSKFIPVVGLSEKISGAAIVDGYTYFEADTGKIYMDVNGERLSFGGGGVQVLYALSSSITESFFDESYFMPLADLED